MLHALQMNRFLIKTEDGGSGELLKLQQFPKGQGITNLCHWLDYKEQAI